MGYGGVGWLAYSVISVDSFWMGLVLDFTSEKLS